MKKILVVDDDPDILTVLKLRLKKAGYEVMVAANGEEALDLIKKETPELVLLDLLLPGIQGEEVCKQIKQDDKLKKIPVILFTASVSDIESRVKKIGADDFIEKPFEAENLLAKIKKFVG